MRIRRNIRRTPSLGGSRGHLRIAPTAGLPEASRAGAGAPLTWINPHVHLPEQDCSITASSREAMRMARTIPALYSKRAVRCASAALIDKLNAAGIAVPPHHTTMLCRFEAIH